MAPPSQDDPPSLLQYKLAPEGNIEGYGGVGDAAKRVIDIDQTSKKHGF